MPEKCRRSKVYETAIRFARMWGVMETLEPLPYISFEKLYDILMAWAEEFDAGGENDFVGFFIKKSSEIKSV